MHASHRKYAAGLFVSDVVLCTQRVHETCCLGLPRRPDALKGSASHAPDKHSLLLRAAAYVWDQMCRPGTRSHARRAQLEPGVSRPVRQSLHLLKRLPFWRGRQQPAVDMSKHTRHCSTPGAAGRNGSTLRRVSATLAVARSGCFRAAAGPRWNSIRGAIAVLSILFLACAGFQCLLLTAQSLGPQGSALPLQLCNPAPSSQAAHRSLDHYCSRRAPRMQPARSHATPGPGNAACATELGASAFCCNIACSTCKDRCHVQGKENAEDSC